MPSWCQYNRNKYTDQHCDSANTQTAREFYVNIVLCLHFARGDVKLGMLLVWFYLCAWRPYGRLGPHCPTSLKTIICALLHEYDNILQSLRVKYHFFGRMYIQ
jgi:hypothetical protein